MQLKSFRVQKFRNIEDTGEVKLLDALTCVVGKNQAGKSALLRALHKFNPHRPAPYDMRREWPRGKRTDRNEKQIVCEVHFALSSEELKTLAAYLRFFTGGSDLSHEAPDAPLPEEVSEGREPWASSARASLDQRARGRRQGRQPRGAGAERSDAP